MARSPDDGSASADAHHYVLEPKYFAEPKPISSRLATGDPISITLQEGYIADFYENVVDVHDEGEIAIVARVRELTGGESIAFDDNALKKEGRVVYYSGDVRRRNPGARGQQFSFSSLPLYGPVRYGGGPILIELAIIEIDENEEKGQLTSLLAALASAGSIAYAPASPILGLLNELGAALIAADQNDIEFRYHCVLRPYRAGSSAHTDAYLQDGFLVIVKQDHYRKNRGGPGAQTRATHSVPWKSLEFDRRRQRLVWDPGASTPCPKDHPHEWRDYTDHTYLVLKVDKSQDPFDLDLQNSYDTLGALVAKLQPDSDAQVDLIEQVSQSVTSLLKQRSTYRQALERIVSIHSNDYGLEGKRYTVISLLALLKDEYTQAPADRQLSDVWRDELLRRLVTEPKLPIDAGHFQSAMTVQQIAIQAGLLGNDDFPPPAPTTDRPPMP